MKKIVLLLFLGALVMLPFLSSSGYWRYLDTSFIPMTSGVFIEYMYMIFYGWHFDFGSYFGHDSSLIISNRIINFLLYYVHQSYIYISFLSVCFLAGYFALRIKYSVNGSYFGALAFTFNPVSIFFLQELGFIYAYVSLPLILLGGYYYLKSNRYIYLLLLLIGGYFLLSYTRTLGLYGLLILLILVFYWKYCVEIYRQDFKKICCICGGLIADNAPFIFSFVYPYLSGDKEHFSGLSNYAASFYDYGIRLFNTVKTAGFTDAFVIQELIPNFAQKIQNSQLFVATSAVFVSGTFLLFLFSKKEPVGYFERCVSILFLLLLFIKASPFFISAEYFTLFVYKVFPFLSNNLNWIFVLYIPLLCLMIADNISMGSQRVGRIQAIMVLSFISLSITPLIFFHTNEKLQSFDLAKAPQDYRDTFYTDNFSKDGALFYPSEQLLFNWAPYPIPIENNTNYKTLFSENSRLVTFKQGALLRALRGSITQNSSIFNLKNIFVFKDIRNAAEGQFDFFPAKDFVAESKAFYEKFKENEHLYVRQDTKNFVQFGIKNDSSYEYFLYSPASITRYNIDEFFRSNIDIAKKVVNIDPDSFGKPTEIDDYAIDESNKSIVIEYKKSTLNPTKIYAKITGADTKKSFMLQLNQTFSRGWKIKWITPKDYREKACEGPLQIYALTQNSDCEYRAKVIDLSDASYLWSKSIDSKNHFEGNFVGNAWLIQPADIPTTTGGEGAIYAVIIYEKQIYYIWALIISVVALSTLFVAILWQEYRLFLSKKSPD